MITQTSLANLKKELSMISGLVLSIISVFLPWYNYSIDSDPNDYQWVYFPFRSWVGNTSNYTLLPELDALVTIFYIQLIFATGLVTLLILNAFNQQIDNTSKMWNLSISYLNSAVCGLIVILFPIFIIKDGAYYPYLEIYHQNGEFLSLHAYSISFGYLMAVFGLIIQLIVHSQDLARKYSKDTGLKQSLKLADIRGKYELDDFSIQADNDNLEIYEMEEKVARLLNEKLEAQFT